MIAEALGAAVSQHDDGHADSLHDLDIIRPGHAVAAAEVTTVVDPRFIQLWKATNGSSDRWIEADLAGAWLVTLEPTSRARRIKQELPALLAGLEQAGVRNIFIDSSHSSPDPLTKRFADLRVVSASQSPTQFPGAIYVTIDVPLERAGGFVPATGDAISTWLPTFLRRPQQADVLHKLERSGAAERHAFVIIRMFSPAPFEVADLLMRADAPLPTAAPDLPPEVTHAWLTGSWGDGNGVRWSPDSRWQRFSKLQAST